MTYSISWAFDLKVAEERVGTEEIDGLVDDVHLAGVYGGWRGSTDLGTDGEEGHGAD